VTQRSLITALQLVTKKFFFKKIITVKFINRQTWDVETVERASLTVVKAMEVAAPEVATG
jgi:hypothetical protein